MSGFGKSAVETSTASMRIGKYLVRELILLCGSKVLVIMTDNNFLSFLKRSSLSYEYKPDRKKYWKRNRS